MDSLAGYRLTMGLEGLSGELGSRERNLGQNLPQLGLETTM